MLYTLVYTSNAAIEFNRYQLLDLLTQARNKNKRLHITGMLIYANKRFIQLLEGEKNTVLSLYREIQNDYRHSNVDTVMQNAIDVRLFSDWTMGYKNINPSMYNKIPGLELFLQNDNAFNPYNLLAYFKHDLTCFRDIVHN